jgi:hypothetical protein
MSLFWVTERKNLPLEQEESDWQARIRGLPDVDVIVEFGKRMKVDTSDEISLRMACGDVCNIERA